MLLGNTDVEQPIGEALAELTEPGRARHGRRDRHDIAMLTGHIDERIGEHRSPTRSRSLNGPTGFRVDDAGGMHLLGLVVLGGGISHALAGDHMHDHRTAVATGTAEGILHRVLIMTVNRTDIFQPQVGEHHLRRHRVLHPDLEAVHQGVGQRTHDRHAAQQLLALVENLLVGRGEPQPCQMRGEPADGRRVTTPIVVDDDDDAPMLGGGDVVEGLPAHASGHGTVADHRDDMAAPLARQLERLGKSVGVGQRRRRMARFHPVVFALGP
ncbi:Uncharacterised protein [Mycobacteroides abscessus subsp. abscessus]|nr:Uncharacterised protein [Mycobacteroides abscessus subsp. abscessus]